jgi:hypothetical protein
MEDTSWHTAVGFTCAGKAVCVCHTESELVVSAQEYGSTAAVRQDGQNNGITTRIGRAGRHQQRRRIDRVQAAGFGGDLDILAYSVWWEVRHSGDDGFLATAALRDRYVESATLRVSILVSPPVRGLVCTREDGQNDAIAMIGIGRASHRQQETDRWNPRCRFRGMGPQ